MSSIPVSRQVHGVHWKLCNIEPETFTDVGFGRSTERATCVSSIFRSSLSSPSCIHKVYLNLSNVFFLLLTMLGV